MTLSDGMIAVLVGVGLQLLVAAAAWGRLEATNSANRRLQDERHEENKEQINENHKENTEALQDLRHDVKRINGNVMKHERDIDYHQREIDRLRGAN